MPVDDVSSIGSGPSVCPEDTGDSSLISDLLDARREVENGGLRLAGEIRHLRRLLDRGPSRRSSDALSEDVWPHRIYHFDATMALFDGQSLKRPLDNGVFSGGLCGPLSTGERRN